MRNHWHYGSKWLNIMVQTYAYYYVTDQTPWSLCNAIKIILNIGVFKGLYFQNMQLITTIKLFDVWCFHIIIFKSINLLSWEGAKFIFCFLAIVLQMIIIFWLNKKNVIKCLWMVMDHFILLTFMSGLNSFICEIKFEIL